MLNLLAVDFETGIEEAWTDIATIVPKLLAFAVVLIVGYFIAKAIAKIFDRVLDGLHFDRAVQKGAVGTALDRAELKASDVLSKIVFYALFLLVLQLAFGLFGTNPVSDLLASVIGYLPKVIAAILIIVIGGAIAAAVKELVEASLGHLSFGRLAATLAAAAIMTVAAFAAVSQLQIAPAIVNGLFYAMLAIIVGSGIIAIGGGGIRPMQARWQKAFDRWDEERPVSVPDTPEKLVSGEKSQHRAGNSRRGH